MRLPPMFLLVGFLSAATLSTPVDAQQQPAGAAPVVPGSIAPVPSEARTDPEAVLRAAVQEMQRLHQSGQRAEAARVAERAHERLATELGPDHPLVAVAQFNVGAALRRAGNTDEAAVALQRALVMETKLGSPQRPSFRQVLRELAEVERARGQIDNAIGLYEAAIGRVRQEKPGTAAEADLLEKQGVLLRHSGSFARAEGQLKAALAISRRRWAAITCRRARGPPISVRH